MGLEQWFYVLSITFFFSFWIIIVVAMVLLYRLYQGVAEMKKTLTSKPVSWLASSAPLFSLFMPVIGKVWDHWRSRKDESQS